MADRPPIPCPECGGTGGEHCPSEFSRDPAVRITWGWVDCERCEGIGHEPCLYCGEEPATEEVDGEAYCAPHAADARRELRRRLPAREVA